MGVVAGIKKRSLARGSGRAGRGTSWERESGTPRVAKLERPCIGYV